MTVYRKCFVNAGTRQLCYDNIHKRASIDGRLPHKAKDVLEEIKKAQKRLVRETQFQKQDRLDKQFDQLNMGAKSHGLFRTEFESLLISMKEAELSTAVDPLYLHRKYLSKLTDTLRSAVLSKTWLLDGDSEPPRKPKSWEEVAQAVEMELENRVDARTGPETTHTLTDCLLYTSPSPRDS